jgi:hypothetical protein
MVPTINVMLGLGFRVETISRNGTLGLRFYVHICPSCKKALPAFREAPPSSHSPSRQKTLKRTLNPLTVLIGGSVNFGPRVSPGSSMVQVGPLRDVTGSVTCIFYNFFLSVSPFFASRQFCLFCILYHDIGCLIAHVFWPK